MVWVLPKAQISPSRRQRPSKDSSSPSTRARKTAVEAKVLASSPRSFPSSREAVDPAPMPTVKPTAWMMAMMENTMPTAPEALVLI